MRPNPTIREIVAKGYLMGWIRPPLNQPPPDMDELVEKQRQQAQGEAEHKRRMERFKTEVMTKM